MIKDIVKALRICGDVGIKLCKGEDPHAKERCKDCAYYEMGMKYGDAQPCFEMWIKAAEELERLSDELAAAKRDIKELIINRDIATACCICGSETCVDDLNCSDDECCKIHATWRGVCEQNGGADND